MNFLASNAALKNLVKRTEPLVCRSFHASSVKCGIEEFFDQNKANEPLITGRAWTAADLRRKSFDDLHKLWYVLYKERNLLLTSRLKNKRAQNPTSTLDENRYVKVKRSMAAIKLVIDERKKIDEMLKQQQQEQQQS